MRRADDERGLAAPVVVTVAGLLVVVTLVAAALGRLLVDHRRVSAAADLAALAGATAVQLGRPPCAAAQRIAADNGVRLAGCTVHGDRVRVHASLTAPTMLDRVVRLRATAYAGPTEGRAVRP
jgi:secretion/DNA translocation related TadE-like protein